MVNRSRNLVVRLADDEHEMMRAIAGVDREPAAALVRRWIRQHYEARGLGAKPAAKGER